MMWFDATANFERFSHRDSISHYLQKISAIGFTDVVVDIRPITGNYYTDITLHDALTHQGLTLVEAEARDWSGTWYCVEGSCMKLREVLGGHPFYSGILADQHQADPDRLRRAVEASLSYSDGLMLFDICHLIACPALWHSLEEGMRNAGMQK